MDVEVPGRLVRSDGRARVRLRNNGWPALPARSDDLLSAVARRTRLSALQQALDDGRYAPAPAHLVTLSKATDGTRRGALLRLEDRIVLGALVRQVAPAIERAPPEPDVVFSPRGADGTQRWSSFERAVLHRIQSEQVINSRNQLGAGTESASVKGERVALGHGGSDVARDGSVQTLVPAEVSQPSVGRSTPC